MAFLRAFTFHEKHCNFLFLFLRSTSNQYSKGMFMFIVMKVLKNANYIKDERLFFYLVNCLHLLAFALWMSKKFFRAIKYLVDQAPFDESQAFDSWHMCSVHYTRVQSTLDMYKLKNICNHFNVVHVFVRQSRENSSF